jgi:hypothetical protein
MQLIKHIYILGILLLSVFFLNSCKPDDEVDKTYGPYTLGEARDYLDFKPGSWWVYQNNKSGLYDTLVLKSISIRSQSFTGKNTVIKDLINFKTYSISDGYEYTYYNLFAPNPDLPSNLLSNPYIEIANNKFRPNDFNAETVSFFYPFDKQHMGSISTFESRLIHIDTSINLPTLKVDNVVVFRCKNDACWNSATVKYYWGKDIGLIKKENIDKNESWELVNFNIEK